MRTLLRGGPVYAPSAPGADAMLVVDDTVAWIGPSSGASVHADSADAVVELDGALVAPAFVDAHVHHTMTGLTLLGLDLRGVASRQDLLDRGILIRETGPAGFLRVSAGTPSEMATLRAALDDLNPTIEGNTP